MVRVRLGSVLTLTLAPYFGRHLFKLGLGSDEGIGGPGQDQGLAPREGHVRVRLLKLKLTVLF